MLVDELGAHTVWLDSDELSPGSDIDDNIRLAVLESDVTVIVVTPGVEDSTGVAMELAVARESGIPVLPLLIDDAALPPGFSQTRSLQVRWSSSHRHVDVAAVADELRGHLPRGLADIAVVGRMKDSEGLAAALGTLLASGVRPARCWGSGSGGAPLATATFFGADAREIKRFGEHLGRTPAMWPWQIARRRLRGWTQTDQWLHTQLAAWFDDLGMFSGRRSVPGSARQLSFGAAVFADGDIFVPDDEASDTSDGLPAEFHRPSDWLQLIAMDLELRLPVLLPRHFDEVGGRRGQEYLLSDLLRFAMGGLDGVRPGYAVDTFPLHVADGRGRRRELTQYPGFWIPWSLEDEDRDWPVVVLVPDESARSSSFWWGLAVDEQLKPVPPDNWLVIELPTDPTDAAEVTRSVLEGWSAPAPSADSLKSDAAVDDVIFDLRDVGESFGAQS